MGSCQGTEQVSNTEIVNQPESFKISDQQIQNLELQIIEAEDVINGLKGTIEELQKKIVQLQQNQQQKSEPTDDQQQEQLEQQFTFHDKQQSPEDNDQFCLQKQISIQVKGFQD